MLRRYGFWRRDAIFGLGFLTQPGLGSQNVPGMMAQEEELKQFFLCRAKKPEDSGDGVDAE